jgi:hypothetical protein
MASKHPDNHQTSWGQCLQQLAGAVLVIAMAGYFLYCLVEAKLPADFSLDVGIVSASAPTVDDDSIVRAIDSCDLPGNAESQPVGWRNASAIADGNRQSAALTAPGIAPALEQAARWQSQRISNERDHFAKDADNRQNRARLNQLRILCLSAAAAFMVGLRTLALNKDSEAPFRPLMQGALLPISVFALLLPLLSTAVSSIATFDNDTHVVISDIRALAQLEQLHGRIAKDITGDPFLCPILRATKALYGATPGTPPMAPAVPINREYFNLCLADRMNRTIAWEQRHEHILNDATQSLAHAGDLPRPGDHPDGMLADPAKKSSKQPPADVCELAFDEPAAPDRTVSLYRDLMPTPHQR